MYLLGYMPKENRLYLGDKELNIVSYSLLLSVLEYQTAVMRGDFEAADKILPSVPREHRTRVAHFLEKQNFKELALSVSTDNEHKFDLALQLKDTKTAYQLALEAQSEQKWRQLAELAMALCQFELSQECLHNANDYAGLLLLATSSGNASMVAKLGQTAQAKGINNVAFLSSFILGDKEQALQLLIDTNRLPEAAFFARTYMPSQVSNVLKLWKESITQKSKSEKSAQALADPLEYENLFPGFNDALEAEKRVNAQVSSVRPKASSYLSQVPNQDRNLMQEGGAGGSTRSATNEDLSDEFEEAPTSPETSKVLAGGRSQRRDDGDDLEEDVNNLNLDDDDEDDDVADEDLLSDD